MVAQTMPFNIHYHGLTDLGLVREANEDVWDAIPSASFFVVADGMGGHQAGEVAAQQAVQNLCAIVQTICEESQGEHNPADMATMIRLAIIEVNRRVYKLGTRHPHLHGMGTTLCCVQFYQQFAICGHVGDSRIYRLREGELKQLTRDHSLYRELVDLGHLKEGPGEEFHYKNVITKAIGTGPSVEPSVILEELRSGDVYLMCSDGLTDLVSFEQIRSIAQTQAANIEAAVKALVDQAKARGGHDNITVVMMKVEENHGKDLPGS